MKTRPKTRSRGFSARKTKFPGVFCKNQGLKHKNWKDPRAKVLKQLGWTASSKSEKLRGLSAKNWAWLELLLNYMDCGLKSKEARDSFAKIYWR